MSFVRNSAIAVALLAAIYQLWLKNHIFNVVGIGRAIRPIETFPWNCHRIVHPQLEGCEDLFLDEKDRVLYAACSGSEARSQWNPALSKYNVSGRRTQGSELVAMHIDEPESNGQFKMHSIRPSGYEGATGDQTLDFVGFDVDASAHNVLDFWLVNHRPPVDAQRQHLDAKKLGSNVTIEVFRYAKAAREMQHVKTIVHPDIHSANKLALTGGGSFAVSNDHSDRVGFRKELDLIVGGGNLVHCRSDHMCAPGTSNWLPFANGLVRGHDGLIYVPFSAATFIAVYRILQDGALEEVARIDVGMPVDNLSVDSSGAIWVAGIPRMLELIDAIGAPFEKSSPSTILKIRKVGEKEYEVETVLEDGLAKVVSGATAAVFDRQSERLFIGGASTPYIVECQARQAYRG